MLQTTVATELSEPLPEIEIKASDIRHVVKSEILESAEVASALQVLLNAFVDVVTTRVLAKLGSVPRTAIVPAAEPKVEQPKVEQPKVASDPNSSKEPRTPRHLSEASRLKIAESQRARWATRERTLSPEAKEKISKSQKARWATRNGKPTPRESADTSGADCPGQHNNSIAEPVAGSKEATLAVREGYKGDTFYISEDGHFIGDDGFVVPQTFDEFLERYPRYIESWARRRLNGQGIEEDIEDWTQELIIHMKYLPPTSKHRAEGKTDVIQTFDPFAQYGASERRWRYYVNMCLTNKYNTIFGKKTKNPVCRAGNIALVADYQTGDHHHVQGEATDEYIYSKSEYLTNATTREETKQNNIFFAKKFIEYVKQHDEASYPVLEAIYEAGSSSDTIKEFCQTCKRLATTVELKEGTHGRHTVGMTQKEFNRARNRLKQLATHFMKQKPPPKSRNRNEDEN